MRQEVDHEYCGRRKDLPLLGTNFGHNPKLSEDYVPPVVDSVDSTVTVAQVVRRRSEARNPRQLERQGVRLEDQSEVAYVLGQERIFSGGPCQADQHFYRTHFVVADSGSEGHQRVMDTSTFELLYDSFEMFDSPRAMTLRDLRSYHHLD